MKTAADKKELNVKAARGNHEKAGIVAKEIHTI